MRLTHHSSLGQDAACSPLSGISDSGSGLVSDALPLRFAFPDERPGDGFRSTIRRYHLGRHLLPRRTSCLIFEFSGVPFGADFRHAGKLGVIPGTRAQWKARNVSKVCKCAPAWPKNTREKRTILGCGTGTANQTTRLALQGTARKSAYPRNRDRVI